MEMVGWASVAAALLGAVVIAVVRNPQKRARMLGPAAAMLTGGAVTSVEGVRTSVDALKAAVDSLSATVASQGRSLAAAEDRVCLLEQKVSDRDETIRGLQKELAQTRQQLKTERAAGKKLRTQVDGMTIELEALRYLTGE